MYDGLYDNIRFLAGKMVTFGNCRQGYDRKRPDSDCGEMWDSEAEVYEKVLQNTT